MMIALWYLDTWLVYFIRTGQTFINKCWYLPWLSLCKVPTSTELSMVNLLLILMTSNVLQISRESVFKHPASLCTFYSQLCFSPVLPAYWMFLTPGFLPALQLTGVLCGIDKSRVSRLSLYTFIDLRRYQVKVLSINLQSKPN